MNQIVAVLPLRDIVVFPHMIVPLFVGREKSVRAIEAIMQEDYEFAEAFCPVSDDRFGSDATVSPGGDCGCHWFDHHCAEQSGGLVIGIGTISQKTNTDLVIRSPNVVS